MDLDEALSLLANETRRSVLRKLVGGDGLSTVDELGRAVARRTGRDGDRVRIELVHEHLPRLADHDVVEYDDRNGDVVLTDAGRRLESLLEDVSAAGPTTAGRA